MKVCDMSSTGSSSCSKGMRKDRQPNQQSLICKREKSRKDTSDINSFVNVMMSIYPEYYGDNQ
ncbi:hypothetical protein NVP1016O_22 [Vibrio phage 1.016.O._10N.286.46.A11]|nr:hypothetical protein NVP1016O_22 [Vibrio phage 1.016.O._10N.286.46.A11]AUR85251.1 hypothetical protein NVP1071A_21 [Vibrio phage 1.071.A._10N.286.46.A12]